MTVYIPVTGILTFLAFYAIIGSLLYFPLYRWQSSFISGNHKEWFPNNYTTFLRGFFACNIAWPVMLVYTLKMEIKRYRRKHR